MITVHFTFAFYAAATAHMHMHEGCAAHKRQCSDRQTHKLPQQPLLQVADKTLQHVKKEPTSVVVVTEYSYAHFVQEWWVISLIHPEVYFKGITHPWLYCRAAVELLKSYACAWDLTLVMTWRRFRMWQECWWGGKKKKLVGTEEFSLSLHWSLTQVHSPGGTTRSCIGY